MGIFAIKCPGEFLLLVAVSSPALKARQTAENNHCILSIKRVDLSKADRKWKYIHGRIEER